LASKPEFEAWKILKKQTCPFRQAAGTPLRGEELEFWALFRHEVPILAGCQAVGLFAL